MDIGYHFDLTQIILKEAGFKPLTIKLALFANGYNDALGNAPEQLLKNLTLEPTKRLHCDNLFQGEQVINYWSQLLGNLKISLQRSQEEYKTSASDNVKVKALLKSIYAIGVAFHVVQDLCAHSTWCERQPKIDSGKYTQDVSFSNQRVLEYIGKSLFKKDGILEDDHLTTERYGDYYTKPNGGDKKWIDTWQDLNDEVLRIPEHGHRPTKPNQVDTNQNLDHQDRRILKKIGDRETSWDEAYVTAFITTRHLMRQIESWLEGPFVKELREGSILNENCDLKEDLDKRMKTLNDLFMYIDSGEENGHWKGPGSGDSVRFVSWAIPRFIVDLALALNKQGTDSPDTMCDPFFDIIKNDSLTKNLYDLGKMGLTAAGAVIAGIDVDPPLVQERVLTLTFHAAEAIPHIEKVADPDAQWVKREVIYTSDGTGAPNLFVRVNCLNVKNAIPIPLEWQTYRERTIQEMNFVEGRFVIDSNVYFKEPWQVVHIVPPDVKKVYCWIQILDDDWALAGDDDELHINPLEDGKAHNPDFIIGEHFHGILLGIDIDNNKLSDSPLTTALGGKQELVDGDKKPSIRSVEGKYDSKKRRHWLGKLDFSMTLATIK